MNFSNLLVDITEKIATITVNRPKVMNALSVETVNELGKAVDGLLRDENVGGLIITGSGEKAFIAGADISELKDLDESGAHEYARRGQGVLSMIENSPKPIVAAINGFALGGGCELAMACHMRIASDNAKFGQPEIKLGVIPGYGGTQRLARLIGKTKAMELCLTGSLIDAHEALQLGLLNYVVKPGEAREKAREIMQSVLSQAPIAAAHIIKAINDGLETSLNHGLQLEAELFGACARSEDWKEGTSAFMEKRKPEFKGK